MSTNDLLKEEYFKLQDQYEEYDSRALQIKGWIGAGSIAGLAIGLDRADAGDGFVWLIIASIAACFWYLETKWKLFQYALRGRIRQIEEHFREAGRQSDVSRREPVPLQIYESWFDNYDSSFRAIRTAALQGFVHLPYSLIIALCLYLYFR